MTSKLVPLLSRKKLSKTQTRISQLNSPSGSMQKKS